MNSNIRSFAVLACTALIGGFVGHKIANEGYNVTPIEKEVIKRVYVDSKPDIKYLNKYIIVPSKVKELVYKDTLIQPKDYVYNISDTIVKGGLKVVVNGNGWGFMDSLKYSFEYSEKTRFIKSKNKGTYLTANYFRVNESDYFGTGFIKVNGRLMYGASVALNNRQSFLIGANVGFKIN